MESKPIVDVASVDHTIVDSPVSTEVDVTSLHRKIVRTWGRADNATEVDYTAVVEDGATICSSHSSIAWVSLCFMGSEVRVVLSCRSSVA